MFKNLVVILTLSILVNGKFHSDINVPNKESPNQSENRPILEERTEDYLKDQLNKKSYLLDKLKKDFQELKNYFYDMEQRFSNKFVILEKKTTNKIENLTNILEEFRISMKYFNKGKRMDEFFFFKLK